LNHAVHKIESSTADESASTSNLNNLLYNFKGMQSCITYRRLVQRTVSAYTGRSKLILGEGVTVKRK